MLSFDPSSNKVTVNGLDLISNEAFKKIRKGDKSRTKERSTQILAYIHIISQLDPEAPFIDSDPSEVRELARRNILGQDGEFTAREKELIEEGLDIYYQQYDSPPRKAKRVFRKKIYEMIATLETTKPEITKSTTTAGTTVFASNNKLIKDTMEGINTLWDEEDKIEARLKNKTGVEGKTWGNKKLSRLERKQRDKHSG